MTNIPDLPDDADILTAALAYAKAGWYVGPCKQSDKSPGSILGARWQHQTSRDPMQITAWFAGSDLGLFLHCGRSGGLVLDVDRWDLLPDLAKDEIERLSPPFQSTRDNDDRRGHYVFGMPEDRMISNGLGTLAVRDSDGRRVSWGEIRGRNGIIVVEPTRHERADVGGRYQWLRRGSLPISEPIAAALPDALDASDPATDAAVLAFLDTYVGTDRLSALKAITNRFGELVAGGHGRHQALVETSIWACREAVGGLFPARMAMERLGNAFVDAMQADLPPGRYPASEFESVWAWAVGQVRDTNPEVKAAEVKARLEVPSTGFMTGKYKTSPAEQADLAALEAEVGHRIDIQPHYTGVPRNAYEVKERYFADREAGIDIAALADDVLTFGPLSTGIDGRFWAYADGVWREARDEVERRVVRLLGGRFRTAHASNCERVIAARVPRIECAPTPRWINFTNGMLDWRTGELHDHSPDHFSTIQHPYDWDPNATCPRFDNFLGQILSEDFQVLAWEMLGYLMLSGNPLHQAFLFYGSGQNGKSTLMRVIAAMIGTGNYSAVTLDALNSNRFAPAALFGKTANLAGDIDATYQESTAAFKRSTGEDVFRAENKHEGGFDFTSWAVPCFSANQIPGSADTTEGYLRRWTVIRFGRHISEAEKTYGLSDLLIAEVPGIAAHAVRALRDLMERGHFDKERGEVAIEQAEFAEKIDAVRQWIDQCTEPVEDESYREDRSVCYKSYKTWCEVNGYKPLRADHFEERIAATGRRTGKARGHRWVADLMVTQYRFKTQAMLIAERDQQAAAIAAATDD